MTVGTEQETAIEQLGEALKADDGDAKNFHIREAIQLLQIEASMRSANVDDVDETAK